MFIVASIQNAADTTVPHVAPRLITTNPIRAVEHARKVAQELGSHGFVSMIVVYKLESEQVYDLMDFAGEDNPHIYFTTWLPYGKTEWIEECRQPITA